jgi:hypothetical protein
MRDDTRFLPRATARHGEATHGGLKSMMIARMNWPGYALADVFGVLR